MKYLVAALAAFCAATGLAVPAHADDLFNICPSGRTGVATMMTSCPFADQVRAAFLVQGGPVINAYSPVTGDYYVMQCAGGFTSHLNNGAVVRSVRCAGGDNAVVIFW